MGAEANLPAKAFDDVQFDEFYEQALPVVYGYLLRLCGGDREQAWDLTQDSWVTVVDRLAQGQTDKATVGFLLSVARSRTSTRGDVSGGCNASCGWCGPMPASPSPPSCRRARCSIICRPAPTSTGWC